MMSSEKLSIITRVQSQVFRIVYRDSMGFFDGIQWDGRSALFFALRETDEAQARIKLLTRE
jgi:hypothetical protein